MLLELGLFGSFRLSRGGSPLPRLRSNAAQSIIAILALRNCRPVERAYLAGMIWPDSTEEQALYNLRRNLTDLRTVLSEDSERLQSPTKRTICLDLDGVRCDLIAFDAAILRGDRAALEDAVTVYTGPLLEGSYDDWVLPERQNRQTDYLRALETLAKEAPPSDALRYLRLLLAVDPAQESAQRQLLLALSKIGDQAGVVRVYVTFRRYLKKELRAEPSLETVTLYKKLRSEGRRVSRSLPESANGILVRLPEPGTPLFGRAAERRDVAYALGESHLVTLIGSGGVGKTRLALASARDIHMQFANGVWLVDLSPVSDPGQIAVAIASALDAPPSKSGSQEDALISHLSKKSLLIVLDNCEQVIRGAAELVGRVLRDCPSIRVLATSRIPLGLKPELTYRVPSLPIPQINTSPEALPAFASVGLFADRARAVAPHFKLDGETGPAIARICSQLDGIPFAIELAAARVRTLTPDEIAAHLDQRFRILTATRPGALRRQQTMQASIEWSWDLLDAQEKACLSRLSVFPSSFSLEAAESIVASDPVERWEVLDLLARLIDWGLLTLQSDGTPVVERYRLLETVRQFAADQLERMGQDVTTKLKHRAFFKDLVAQSRPHMGTDRSPLWMSLLATEHDNLRAALDRIRCDLTPEAGQEGLTLAHSLAFFWTMRGHAAEGRSRLTSALEHPGAQEVTVARANALRGAGMLTKHQADSAGALKLVKQSLAAFRSLEGETKGVADALMDMGNIAIEQQDYEEARSKYKESLALYESIGESVRANRARSNLGVVAQAMGDLDEAEASALGCLENSRKLGEKYSIAIDVANLGLIRYYRGDFLSAKGHLEESLMHLTEMGQHDFHMVNTKSALALALIRLDETNEAKLHLLDANTICRDANIAHGAVIVCASWARYHLSSGNHTLAARLTGCADAVRSAVNVPREPLEMPEHNADLAMLWEQLGGEAFERGYSVGAKWAWEQALDEAAPE